MFVLLIRSRITIFGDMAFLATFDDAGAEVAGALGSVFGWAAGFASGCPGTVVGAFTGSLFATETGRGSGWD